MSKQIITRKCLKCKKLKPTPEFHRCLNSYQNVCKICDLKRLNKYRQTEHGKTIIDKINSKYNKSEKGKRNKRHCEQLYHIRYPQRRKANRMVNIKIKNGKLPRPGTLQCSCGEQAKEYHHPNGYEPKYWFDIIPICIKCHNKLRLVG